MQFFLTAIWGFMLVCLAAANPVSITMELNPAGNWSWSAGTDTQCTKFVVPKAGDYCDKVARFAGVSTKWFMWQNPQIDAKCRNLWTNTKYCVAPPNGQPGRNSPGNTESTGQKEAQNKESDSKDTSMVIPESETGVVLRNKSPNTVCFAFEIGSEVSKSNLPSSASCPTGHDNFPGIVVPSGQAKFHRFYPGFHGAINIVVNGVRGARHEVTFVSGSPPGAFYDTDYEFGLSSSTFGPFDGRPRPDGGDSLMGEEDILGKINQQFKKLGVKEQQALVSASGKDWVRQGPSGDLTWVNNQKDGPHEMWYFLQCIVKVRGYVMPGSEIDKTPIPGTHYAEMVAAADNSTKEVLTQQLLLTVYPDHRQAN